MEGFFDESTNEGDKVSKGVKKVDWRDGSKLLRNKLDQLSKEWKRKSVSVLDPKRIAVEEERKLTIRFEIRTLCESSFISLHLKRSSV